MAKTAQRRMLFFIAALIMGWDVLALSVTYVCKYPIYSDYEGVHSSNIMTLKVRVEADKAYMLGNNDTLTEALIVPQSDGNGLTLVEITDSGNVTTTTIDANNVSVHSRNTVMFGDLIPSQYYGKCVQVGE